MKVSSLHGVQRKKPRTQNTKQRFTDTKGILGTYGACFPKPPYPEAWPPQSHKHLSEGGLGFGSGWKGGHPSKRAEEHFPEGG